MGTTQGGANHSQTNPSKVVVNKSGTMKKILTILVLGCLSGCAYKGTVQILCKECNPETSIDQPMDFKTLSDLKADVKGVPLE